MKKKNTNLSEDSPRRLLWFLIEETILKTRNTFRGKPLDTGIFKGSASDLFKALNDPHNGLTDRERASLPPANTMAKYLKTLSEAPSHTGMIAQSRTGKGRFWVLLSEDRAQTLSLAEVFNPDRTTYLSPQARLWALIELKLLKAPEVQRNPAEPRGAWVGSASELWQALNAFCMGLTNRERKELPPANTIAKYLKWLSQAPGYERQINFRRTGKSRYWILMTKDRAANAFAMDSPQREFNFRIGDRSKESLRKTCHL